MAMSDIDRAFTEIKSLRESRHELNKIVSHHDFAIKELLKAPTNHDLQVMLIEMKGDVKAILTQQKAAKEWQDEHQKTDKKEFEAIREEIAGMNKYATSIAIVAAGLGFIGSWVWSKVTGG